MAVVVLSCGRLDLNLKAPFVEVASCTDMLMLPGVLQAHRNETMIHCNLPGWCPLERAQASCADKLRWTDVEMFLLMRKK